MAILEVAQLEKSFGGTKVLRDISFSLEEGQALSIRGGHRLVRQRKDHAAAVPELFGDTRQRPHRRPGTESAGRKPVPSGAAAEPAALRAGVSGF